MSAILYNDLHSIAVADPHGYRVASRIHERDSLGGAPFQRSNRGEQGMGAAANQLASQEVRQAHQELTRLVERMRRGDQRALEELYDATVGKLYALASAILRIPEDADEVVCGTYSYAWANATRFDATRANALGWLLMLCRSRALDRLRQRRNSNQAIDIEQIAESEPSDRDRPDDLLSILQQRSRVHTALSKLSPERRTLVSMAFLHGLSHQEIAGISGLALGTVKSHVRRALVQLRAELESP